MAVDIVQQVSRIVRSLNARFSLNGRPLTIDEVCADNGMLPAISRRADQLCALCLGYGIGATYEETENAILGQKVVFDNITPAVLRILCITDVVCELMQNAPPGEMAPLDQLMYD